LFLDTGFSRIYGETVLAFPALLKRRSSRFRSTIPAAHPEAENLKDIMNVLSHFLISEGHKKDHSIFKSGIIVG